MPSLVLDKNTADVLNVNADTIATELAAVVVPFLKTIFLEGLQLRQLVS